MTILLNSGRNVLALDFDLKKKKKKKTTKKPSITGQNKFNYCKKYCKILQVLLFFFFFKCTTFIIFSQKILSIKLLLVLI